ncbi:hypothetical protein SH1V18_14800 [Vallitalea longa]|uniref:Uncharacterized protein n=1 Tax=Vallitalea longa TaxID=2936439 RepID=A0A9W5YAD9_9FIRM|nr:hypothetical protein [Vallitalea longa]GKX29000.1 hypothetical protein SH1V18_14800 [Vallitalea longa]
MKVYRKIIVILIIILVLLGFFDFIINDELFLNDYIRGTFTETIGIIVTLIFVDLIFKRNNDEERRQEEISKIKRSNTVIKLSITRCLEYGAIITTPVEDRGNDIPNKITNDFTFSDMCDLFNPSLIDTDDFSPVVLKYLKAHDDLIVSIEKVLYTIDYKYYSKLNKLFIEYISKTKGLDLYQGIQQDSINECSVNKIIKILKEHTGEVKRTNGNIINKYITLFYLIKDNNKFISDYNNIINEIINNEPKKVKRSQRFKILKNYKTHKKNKTINILHLSQFIASIAVTIAAVWISNMQLQIHKFEVQPHFNISTFYGEEMENGKVRDLNLCIYNSGQGFYDFKSCQICFVEIETEQEKIYLPLTYFFGISTEILGDGDIVYEARGYRNNIKLSNLKNVFLTRKNSYGFLRKIIFTKIEYQDMMGKYHTQYFDSDKGRVLNNSKGKYIFKLHNDYIHKLSFLNTENLDYVNIDNINVEILENYIKSDIQITEEDFLKVYQ